MSTDTNYITGYIFFSVIWGQFGLVILFSSAWWKCRDKNVLDGFRCRIQIFSGDIWKADVAVKQLYKDTKANWSNHFFFLFLLALSSIADMKSPHNSFTISVNCVNQIALISFSSSSCLKCDRWPKYSDTQLSYPVKTMSSTVLAKS